MNEEQSVLDFFAQTENLPLALSVAEQMDGIRQRLNNEFWLALRERLDGLLTEHALPWDSEITEDRNSEKCLVGLYMQPQAEQRVFLRPFMEQQFLGEGYRIYHGLMWNVAPDMAQKSLPAVETLRARLDQAGFKPSDSFLAWQWLSWHPRRKDFLSRYLNRREELLDEAVEIWSRLLLTYGAELRQANIALQPAPRNASISLDQLRDKLKQA